MSGAGFPLVEIALDGVVLAMRALDMMFLSGVALPEAFGSVMVTFLLADTFPDIFKFIILYQIKILGVLRMPKRMLRTPGQMLKTPDQMLRTPGQVLKAPD